MGEIVQFADCRGCRKCENLAQIGKGTYICLVRVHMDDSDVMPIRDGERTEDWYICDGEAYVRTFNTHSNAN